MTVCIIIAIIAELFVCLLKNVRRDARQAYSGDTANDVLRLMRSARIGANRYIYASDSNHAGVDRDISRIRPFRQDKIYDKNKNSDTINRTLYDHAFKPKRNRKNFFEII